MIVLKLEKIGSHIQGITPPFGAYMAECAAVCFDSQGHKSGVQLPFSDEKMIALGLAGNPPDDIATELRLLFDDIKKQYLPKKSVFEHLNS